MSFQDDDVVITNPTELEAVLLLRFQIDIRHIWTEKEGCNSELLMHVVRCRARIHTESLID